MASEHKRLDARTRRRLLVVAAMSQFAERGYEATRMSDVAAAAGVAKGLLYKHFATKEALFEAATEQVAADFEQRVAERLAAQGEGTAIGGVGAVEVGVRQWAAQLADDVVAGRLIDPGVHDLYDGLRRRMREIATTQLTTVLPDVDPDVGAFVVSAVEGATEHVVRCWSEAPERVPLADALDIGLGVVLDGLRATLEAHGQA